MDTTAKVRKNLKWEMVKAIVETDNNSQALKRVLDIAEL